MMDIVQKAQGYLYDNGFYEIVDCAQSYAPDVAQPVFDDDMVQVFIDAYEMGKKDAEKKLKELIIELEKVRGFYADWKSWDTTSHAYHEQYNGSIKSDDSLVHDKLNGYFGGKLARTPLKNQKLLDEIKRGE